MFETVGFFTFAKPFTMRSRKILVTDPRPAQSLSPWIF
jgi:hypothetical protein